MLAAYPAAKLRKAEFPTASRNAYLVHLSDAGDAFQVAVGRDGSNPQRLGAVANGLEFLRVFHEDLTMAISAAPSSVSKAWHWRRCCSPGWIWWPGRARALRSLRLPTKGPVQAKLYGWHRTFGVVVGLLLIPSVITGFVLAIGGFLPSGKPVGDLPARVAADNESRLALARDLFPVLRCAKCASTAAPARCRVSCCRDGDDGLRAPISDVNFNSRSGAVTQVTDGRRNTGYAAFASPNYAAFAAWGYPIHTAQIGGKPLRSLLLLTGAGAAALAGLGVSLWWVAALTKGNRRCVSLLSLLLLSSPWSQPARSPRIPRPSRSRANMRSSTRSMRRTAHGCSPPSIR